jgi:hypothetical protein
VRKPGSEFKVYQNLAYQGMPDLERFGIRRAQIVGRGFWVDDSKRNAADPAKIRQLLAKYPRDDEPMVIDIEHLPISSKNPSSAANVDALIQIVDAFRSVDPGKKLGYYAIIPQADYWRALDIPVGARAQWQRDNDLAQRLEPHVDLIFPSIYTFYDDRVGWVKRAETAVCEARRLSKKPVIVFLWPEYHESATKAGEYISPDYWELQLRTIHRVADGVIIFGGYDIQAKKVRKWDDPAWWSVTRKLLDEWRSGTKFK